MNPKLKVGALVVVVLGVATVFQLQQVKIKRSLAENADLSTQLAQMVSLQDTNELLGIQLKAAVETSQAYQRELLRLRGQGVRTRQLEQENIQLKAQRQQAERQVLEPQSAGADYASRVATHLQTVKTAVADFYAKYGSLPNITNFIEPTLTGEGFLEEATAYSSDVRTRVVEISDPMAPVTAANAAYSLSGYGTNNVFGAVVVEGVVVNVTATRASELSLRIDGPSMTSPIGEADLNGRVKFDAIPLEGSGEVHVYLTHR